MKYRILLAGLGLILALAACAPQPQLRSDKYLNDDSYITGEPCGPPCWRGITPGETSWQDAITIIEDDPSLDNLKQQAAEDSDEIGAAWSPADGESCCQMFSSKDGETVELVLLQTAPGEKLQAVLDAHGEPDYVTGDTVSDNQALVGLYYAEIPMFIYVFVAGETGDISAESDVIGFAYLTADAMQEIIDKSELHTWDGYASYKDYMDSDPEITPIPTASEEN